MSAIPEKDDIHALYKKLKSKQNALIYVSALGVGFIIGAVKLLQLDDTVPFGLLFALLGIIAIIGVILLFKKYRALQQSINRDIHNDSDAAHTYQKADTFEKKKQLRYYPFMLLLAFLCLMYLILSNATVSPYYYLLLLILFPVGLIRYFNDKKTINKKIQENKWDAEESESFIAERKKDTKAAAKTIGIILVAILVVYIIVNIVTSSPSNPYEDIWDKDPNTWSDEEKEYVDDFFDWLDKQNKD